jgi:3',5'-cyclic AMP phosphodiesterase CpdA
LRKAAAFLKAIADRLSIPKDHRLLVPGNHDVDWHLSRLSTKIKDPWYQSHRQSKFSELMATTDFLFCARGVPQQVALSTGKVHFFLLDTPFDDVANTTPHHGRLGGDQLGRLRALLTTAPKDSLKIVALHHHITPLGRAGDDPDFSLLADARDLIDILRDNFVNLVIHGHQHRPGFEHLDGRLAPISLLAAGSATAHLAALNPSDTQNAFHVVLFDDIGADSAHGQIHSRVFSHTRGWVKPARDGAGLPPKRPFGRKILQNQLESWADETVARCKDVGTIKLDTFLLEKPGGDSCLAEDLIAIIKRRHSAITGSSHLEFLYNHDQDYWQMQFSEVTP